MVRLSAFCVTYDIYNCLGQRVVMLIFICEEHVIAYFTDLLLWL